MFPIDLPFAQLRRPSSSVGVALARGLRRWPTPLTTGLLFASAMGCQGNTPAPAGVTNPSSSPLGDGRMAPATPATASLEPPNPTPVEASGESRIDPPASAKVVVGRVVTEKVDDYDDAPGSPDPDDPAIWLDPSGSGAAFVFGTLKEAGLRVFDVSGRVLQTIAPPNRPRVSELDPFTPIGVGGAVACPDSTTGDDFGRFNNVHVEYGLELAGPDGDTRRIDIAVVSDRGCDTLRIYQIDPSREGGPLIDITAADVPRLFPTRFEQPSPIQSPGVRSAEVENPLEDSNTAYGLTTFRLDDSPVHALVSQNNRGVIGQFELRDAGNGSVTYARVREFRFSPVFDVAGRSGDVVQWSPCREEVDEDLQFEGLVVDTEAGVLYAAQEVIGIWQVPIDDDQGDIVSVSQEWLIEKTLTFGAPFFAVPNTDAEFTCELTEPAELPSGTIVGSGVAGAGGLHLAADVEGLAIYDAGDGEGYLIASSQGDNTFHIYDREDVTAHLGSFTVQGAGETDGHDLISLPLGTEFPQGALILQNGGAAPPADTSAVNGFEFDGSGDFIFVAWEDIATLFDLSEGVSE